MRVLDISAFDAILGYDWLKPHSPMTCHWAKKTMEFVHRGHQVKLQGLLTPDPTIPELTADQLVKCWKGNEVWALVMVHEVLPPSSDVLPKEIQGLLQDYADVFAAPNTLPPNRIYDHSIPLLPNAVPVNSRPYRYSPHHKDEIERQVKEMLQAGLIVPSCSPFASPVLLIQKKDGSWRFCVDYRRLNELTIKNRFPMPIMEEILEELAGSHYFTKLDMRSGYHQVKIKPEDEHKTAFKTHHGHYQFRVMPFGLKNAPATFQCLMNSILAPFLRKFVMVFLDDILIYSPSLPAHVDHLKQVLDQLRAHNLYMKLSKCSFAQLQLEYLGHIISGAGVATDPAKTIAMV